MPQRLTCRTAAAAVLAVLVGCGPAAGPAGPPELPGPPWSAEPAFYTAPDVAGADLRTIHVEAGDTASLDQALRNAQPGDTIELASGRHWPPSGDLVISASGTPDHWIRIRGAEARRAVLDLGRRGELRVEGSYLAIENLDIVQGAGNNLHIAPGSVDVSHVIVRGCTIRDLAAGPGAAIKINRNNPRGTGVGRLWIEGNDLSESIENAIVDGVGASEVVVRGNFIHDNVNGTGVFFKGGSSSILIDGNLVARIRGNSAIKLGGDTEPEYFHPEHPDVEGVDQVVRNNLVADCDDAVFEIRGLRRGWIYHNTVVTQTDFAVFRFQYGRSASATAVGNDDVSIANNLIVGTGGDPQYARNDAAPGRLSFVSQAWVGRFHNSGSPGPAIPSFPQFSDLSIEEARVFEVLRGPDYIGLSGVEDAAARFRPARSSLVIGAAVPSIVVTHDALGRPRPPRPAIGALEPEP